MSDVLELVRRAHAGQVDKQGRDYVEHHLLPIAELLRPYGEEAYAAGLLHDILEDTATTSAELLAAGVPTAVVRAVESVSRRPGEPYEQLISRAAADPLGRLVKLADTWVNLTGLEALAGTDPVTAERLRVRYTSARARLTSSLIMI
jgi:(p)ppGpp synthase/HD superfamily hydrolase